MFMHNVSISSSVKRVIVAGREEMGLSLSECSSFVG